MFNYKDSSTPADPSKAIVKGVQDVLEIKKAKPETDMNVSDDGMTWTVTIRDDVKFTDGEPLTHEIGLVLGYPPVDVEGFIKKGGRDFYIPDIGNVYGNLEDALKTFEAYDRARDYVISMTGNGNEIRDILAAS